MVISTCIPELRLLGVIGAIGLSAPLHGFGAVSVAGGLCVARATGELALRRQGSIYNFVDLLLAPERELNVRLAPGLGRKLGRDRL